MISATSATSTTNALPSHPPQSYAPPPEIQVQVSAALTRLRQIETLQMLCKIFAGQGRRALEQLDAETALTKFQEMIEAKSLLNDLSAEMARPFNLQALSINNGTAGATATSTAASSALVRPGPLPRSSKTTGQPENKNSLRS